jgi:hypothetical protein
MYICRPQNTTLPDSQQKTIPHFINGRLIGRQAEDEPDPITGRPEARESESGRVEEEAQVTLPRF